MNGNDEKKSNNHGRSDHIMFAPPLEPYPDHFEGYQDVLKTNTLDNLYRKFRDTDHLLNSSPSAEAIRALLNAAYDFRFATGAEMEIGNEELLAKLIAMGEALKIASAAYDRCPENSVRPVLAVAIERCRASVEVRLKELAEGDEELNKLLLHELNNAIARSVPQNN